VRYYGAASRLEGLAVTMPADDPAVHERLRKRFVPRWATGATKPVALGASMSVGQAVTAAVASADR
jgi:hypothetical protein